MKKRILSFCLCFILLFALSVSASASETYEYPIEEMGLTLKVPEEFISTIGMFEIFPMGEADTGINVMMFEYVALSEEDCFALLENEDISEEDQARVRSAMREMAYVFAIDGNRTLSDLINTLDLGSYPAENFSEIGKTEDVTFYLMIDKEGDSAYTASIAPEFAEEYTTLQAGLVEVLKSASFERPQAPGADLVGQVLSFESEDIDGNPVSSEDIFSQHEITMVNIWATWCGPCKSELEELGEIDRRLSSKDCAILGICIDADESPDEARALISENRMDYLNILAFDDMDEVLEIEGYPTTVFVGRSGEILARPISGVPSDISRYETTIDSLLAGDGAAISDSSDATVGTVPGDGSTYNVIVRDSEGDPVKGVAVQFCSDTSCMVGKTDADGVASFEADEGMVYTIHILKVPEGVEKTNEEFSTLDVYSDTYVILQKTA